MAVMYLLNVFCVFFSGFVAHRMFENGHTKLGWANVGASALNVAILIDAFVKVA